MGANQIGIIHISIVDVLPGLHLQLQLFHHITFANQVVGDLDAGDAGEGRCQDLGFVFVGGQGLGCHFDGHTREGFGRVDKPLHLVFLLSPAEHGNVTNFGVEKYSGRLHFRQGSSMPKTKGQ